MFSTRTFSSETSGPSSGIVPDPLCFMVPSRPLPFAVNTQVCLRCHREPHFTGQIHQITEKEPPSCSKRRSTLTCRAKTPGKCVVARSSVRIEAEWHGHFNVLCSNTSRCVWIVTTPFRSTLPVFDTIPTCVRENVVKLRPTEAPAACDRTACANSTK